MNRPAGGPAGAPAGDAHLCDALRCFEASGLGPRVALEPPLRASDVQTVTSGGEVSDRAPALGASYVEGRPVTDGVGVLLVQPAEWPAT